jgi:nucleotide-binding universal stress UspA family protein
MEAVVEPFTPHRILAATDFSDLSSTALRHAVLWAQHFKAELRVLHVFDFPPGTGDPRFVNLLDELHREARESRTKQLAEHVLLHVPADLPVTRELGEGYPPDVIEACAETWGADLVVLGTHGLGGLSRLLLGSVAERTLRMAQHPTLIVREVLPRDASHPVAPRIGHILCPVNYSEVARAAFEHAAAVARAFSARLTAVFSVEEKHATPENLRAEEERLRAWLPTGTAAKCWIQALTRHGEAAEQVINFAREAAVDLVVMGAQHRRFAGTTVLGVTTVRVTRHAPCPVLVVPRPSDV